jgi:hypothetical protein
LEYKEIFNIVKKDMEKEIRNMEFESVSEVKEKLDHHFKILNSVKVLCEISSVTIDKSDALNDLYQNEKEKEQSQDSTSPVSMEFLEESNEQVKSYLFERKLRGGFIPELKTFVPESAVRSLGIENGDYLFATEKGGYTRNNGKKYRFEIAKKGDSIDAQGRVELKYCLVEKDGELLVVKESMLNGGLPIRLNESRQTFLLRDEDIREFNLKAGDVVDVAYNESNPLFNKVLWKHPIDELEFSETPTSSVNKKKKNKEGVKSEKFEDESLDGKRIMVIGCEPRKSMYKYNIEKRGGEFLWAEGIEAEERLSAMIKKSDAVILLIKFMKHRASKLAVSVCKENDINYGVVDNLGIKSVIDEATYQVSKEKATTC